MKDYLYKTIGLIVLLIAIQIFFWSICWIAIHVSFLLLFLLGVILVLLMRKSRILTIKNIPILVVGILFSILATKMGGVSISSLNFFNTVSPIKILCDETSDTNINSTVNFKFPFWNAFWIRGFNDLLVKKGSYPCFHNIVAQKFYVPDGGSINKKKVITCVLKNLGSEPLIVTSVGKIEFKIDGSSEPMPGNHFVPFGFKDLPQLLNKVIQNSPIILYPLEEIVLFRVQPDVYEELLTIEIEINHADYLGEPDLVNYKNVYKYCQIDKVKFNANSPRVLHAEIKYPKSNTSPIEKMLFKVNSVMTYLGFPN
ncbi:MAG: hypothetical protein V1933_04740 [Candidatus Omnitrophota bacterium]